MLDLIGNCWKTIMFFLCLKTFICLFVTVWIWIFWWNWCSCCFLLLSVTQCFQSLGTDGTPPDSAHSNVRFIVLHRKSKIKQHCRRWSSTSATSNTVWYSQVVEREYRERRGERERGRENKSQKDLEERKRKLKQKQKQKSIYHFLSLSLSLSFSLTLSLLSLSLFPFPVLFLFSSWYSILWVKDQLVPKKKH